MSVSWSPVVGESKNQERDVAYLVLNENGAEAVEELERSDDVTLNQQ